MLATLEGNIHAKSIWMLATLEREMLAKLEENTHTKSYWMLAH